MNYIQLIKGYVMRTQIKNQFRKEMTIHYVAKDLEFE